VGSKPEAEDRFLSLSGLKFHYRDWGGTEAPPLVLLHGATASSRLFDHIAQGLSYSHRVLVVDQRGHGETDWVSDYDWHRWIEDVGRFVDALGLDTFDLVGHSMGGAVACRFAGMHPDRVRHLILLEAWYADIVYSSEWEHFWSLLAQLDPEDGFASHEDYINTFLTLFPRADRDVVDASATTLIRDEAGPLRRPRTADPSNTWESQPTEDEENELRRKVACPTLVAQAEYSEMHVPNDNQRVAAIYSKGEAAIVKGAGHALAYENTAFTTNLISSFIVRT